MTSKGTVRIPKSRRQRSAATGSGPASITTPQPAATGTTIRSPCPTAQATTTAPAGGQSTASTRTGTTPPTPAGHGTTAPGNRAPCSATNTNHHAGQLPSQARNAAPVGHSGDTAAAATPSTVAGATAGVASRLAATATTLIEPDSPARTGATAIWAAAGTASASATPGGTRRRRNPSRHRGASHNSAPVARTDMANPA